MAHLELHELQELVIQHALVHGLVEQLLDGLLHRRHRRRRHAGGGRACCCACCCWRRDALLLERCLTSRGCSYVLVYIGASPFERGPQADTI